MKLTNANYFSPRANREYFSVSQWKAFRKCQNMALAEIRGKYVREETPALLVGSYVDAYFDQELEQFKATHPNLFKKDGTLKAEYVQAEQIIERIKRDRLMMKYLAGGQRQVIMSGEIEGVKVKIKVDTLHPDKIVDGKVTSTKRFCEIDETYKQWLRTNILPQPVNFDPAIKLPEATGRRYRAKASCVVDWSNDRKFVGTLDALAAIVSPDGSVYSLGNAAAYGPIRSMCTNKDKTHLWGVAGDDEDLGYVFEYDDKNGLRQRGIINYNIPTHFDGPTVANVLSSVCMSPDEKYLAIGSMDRIASVHVMALD